MAALLRPAVTSAATSCSRGDRSTWARRGAGDPPAEAGQLGRRSLLQGGVRLDDRVDVVHERRSHRRVDELEEGVCALGRAARPGEPRAGDGEEVEGPQLGQVVATLLRPQRHLDGAARGVSMSQTRQRRDDLRADVGLERAAGPHGRVVDPSAQRLGSFVVTDHQRAVRLARERPCREPTRIADLEQLAGDAELLVGSCQRPSADSRRASPANVSAESNRVAPPGDRGSAPSRRASAEAPGHHVEQERRRGGYLRPRGAARHRTPRRLVDSARRSRRPGPSGPARSARGWTGATACSVQLEPGTGTDASSSVAGGPGGSRRTSRVGRCGTCGSAGPGPCCRRAG